MGVFNKVASRNNHFIVSYTLLAEYADIQDFNIDTSNAYLIVYDVIKTIIDKP